MLCLVGYLYGYGQHTINPFHRRLKIFHFLFIQCLASNAVIIPVNFICYTLHRNWFIKCNWRMKVADDGVEKVRSIPEATCNMHIAPYTTRPCCRFTSPICHYSFIHSDHHWSLNCDSRTHVRLLCASDCIHHSLRHTDVQRWGVQKLNVIWWSLRLTNIIHVRRIMFNHVPVRRGHSICRSTQRLFETIRSMFHWRFACAVAVNIVTPHHLALISRMVWFTYFNIYIFCQWMVLRSNSFIWESVLATHCLCIYTCVCAVVFDVCNETAKRVVCEPWHKSIKFHLLKCI